ncbi:PREDICTED: uncharacterized protein LOC109208301 [Nicotiana attenuata]|uniref:Uncharacterized protein n=1 Tax=Nicotiana attenuata TaxID=49451 RepID=A0A314KRM5_NICAT|nr:PREDICTED: uncharacterized protein LOC109208301 [Nicotiana attenuata]OIT31737.1 hypothetical protein A4A49_31442 [Nicotiana attenuata]
MDNHGVEASSPLATVEDIQKRLTRPPPLTSPQPPSSAITSHLFELQQQNSSNVDTSKLQKRRKLTEKLRANVKVTNQKLEDYFDLALLSSIRAKMNNAMKKKVTMSMKVKSEFEEFVVWPAGEDDLEVFSESSRRTDDEAIVDLKNDDDNSFGNNGEEIQVDCVDPFQQFESTALIRFKR